MIFGRVHLSRKIYLVYLTEKVIVVRSPQTSSWLTASMVTVLDQCCPSTERSYQTKQIKLIINRRNNTEKCSCLFWQRSMRSNGHRIVKLSGSTAINQQSLWQLSLQSALTSKSGNPAVYPQVSSLSSSETEQEQTHFCCFQWCFTPLLLGTKSSFTHSALLIIVATNQIRLCELRLTHTGQTLTHRQTLIDIYNTTHPDRWSCTGPSSS